jgi:hypothetical protein
LDHSKARQPNHQGGDQTPNEVEILRDQDQRHDDTDHADRDPFQSLDHITRVGATAPTGQ